MSDYLTEEERKDGRASVLQTAKTEAVCPHCGKKMSVFAGIKPKNCPFCRKPMEGEAEA